MKSENYQSYYLNSYEECRTAFLKSISNNKGKYNTLNQSIQVESANDSGLFIDLSHFKSHHKTNNLIIFTSGLHGIEGYTGSTLQRFLIDKMMTGEVSTEGNDLLFVHALNPWGFKNKRRVNEKNVDLNRNFSITEDLFFLLIPDIQKFIQSLNLNFSIPGNCIIGLGSCCKY